MRRNDLTEEYFSLASLLELRPGDIALDARTEPDALLPIMYHEVTERGRTVGLCFGQETRDKVMEQIEKMEMRRVEILPCMPLDLPFKDNLFHGIVMRHIAGLPSIEPTLYELWRVARSGARIIVRHTDWSIKLPHANEEDLEMIEALKAPSCGNGKTFFECFEQFKPRAWREIRYDVFTVANRDPRAHTRYDYDWRTLMRDQLIRSRRFMTRDILAFISKLEETRGAKVVGDRYLALGVKP